MLYLGYQIVPVRKSYRHGRSLATSIFLWKSRQKMQNSLDSKSSQQALLRSSVVLWPLSHENMTGKIYLCRLEVSAVITIEIKWVKWKKITYFITMDSDLIRCKGHFEHDKSILPPEYTKKYPLVIASTLISSIMFLFWVCGRDITRDFPLILFNSSKVFFSKSVFYIPG